MNNLAVTLTAIELLAIISIAGIGCLFIGIGIGKTLEGKK